MAINPNFPNLETGWGAKWNANGGAVPLDGFVNLADRARGAIGTQRGRQYETDQVQSGTLSGTLRNTDGALDPANTAGPWFGHIGPYQPYKLRAQWPPTANLLSGVVAQCAGLSTGALPSGVSVYGLTPTVAATTVPFAGTNVFQFVVPSASPVGTHIAWTSEPGVTPGTSYSLTLHARDRTNSTTIQVMPFISWIDANGAVISEPNGTSSTLTGASTGSNWTTLTVTATAPAGASAVQAGLSVAGTTTAQCNVQLSGIQWEVGNPSAYVTPGTWYPIYSGFAERWPQSWDLDNTFSIVSPTAVDAFALLSQQILSDSFTQEVNGHAPRFFYPLGDPQGSTVFADQTGHNPPVRISSPKTGPGVVTAGAAITSASATGGFVGAGQTVLNITNQNPGTATSSGNASFLEMDRSGISGLASSSSTRMVAFRYTGPPPTSGNVACIWSLQDTHNSWSWNVGITSTGAIRAFGTVTFDGLTDVTFAGTSVNDGNWHLLHIVGVPANPATESPAGYAFYLDGVSIGGVGGVGQILSPNSDVYGCRFNAATLLSDQNYQGDIADVGEFPSALSATDIANMHAAWRSACAGEGTGARYARVLRYAGYSGAAALDTGLTASMGPADFSGSDALTALNAIVETEGGAHFVSAGGAITFRGRAARYNALTPTYTLGERTDLGEFPYEEVELDYDSTHLGNIVTVTQASTSQAFVATDAVSQAKYFPRTITRTVNSTNPLECQDAANYLVSRYRNPATRVTALKLHPAAYPALWPVCLSLELGTRVRIMRRPLGRPAMTVDAFVEQIQWDLDDSNNAFVTLQCSPVDLTPYATFDSASSQFDSVAFAY